MQKRVDVIGIQMDLGASKRGVNMGPSAIRYANICEKLNELGVSFCDKGDIIPKPKDSVACAEMHNHRQIFEANSRLYSQVLASLKDGALPVVLGGDHCVAAGSAEAAVEFYHDLGIIWIDAHGDFNDEKSSPTGNMHGMPFSALCGAGPDSMVSFNGKPTFINPGNAVQVGGRDIDCEERNRLKKAGVTVFSISDIDRMGIFEVMQKAIAIASNGTRGYHVSFDIDAVTPDEAPGVGTPVHSGLTVREAFLAAEMVAEDGKLLSLDMVEVNPILDISNKTGVLACELILSMLGKTVY